MANVLEIQVVNINGLSYTKEVVRGLKHQNAPFSLKIVDQASEEYGTVNYFNWLEMVWQVIMSHARDFQVQINTHHRPLNSLWNEFYESTKGNYLCFLNNDVELPGNFVSDTVSVLDLEPEVGIVIHATNCLTQQEELKYEILETGWVQGWDHTVRREAFTPIPEQLHTYGGDDWLFCNAYDKGWKVAVILSSPIVHYGKRSRHSMYGGPRHKRHDEANAKELGILRGYRYGSPWAKRYKE